MVFFLISHLNNKLLYLIIILVNYYSWNLLKNRQEIYYLLRSICYESLFFNSYFSGDGLAKVYWRHIKVDITYLLLRLSFSEKALKVAARFMRLLHSILLLLNRDVLNFFIYLQKFTFSFFIKSEFFKVIHNYMTFFQ